MKSLECVEIVDAEIKEEIVKDPQTLWGVMGKSSEIEISLNKKTEGNAVVKASWALDLSKLMDLLKK